MQSEPLLCYGFHYLIQWYMNVRGYNKTKAASHSQMPSVGNFVDGFTVKKTTQEICNSQKKMKQIWQLHLLSNMTNLQAIVFHSKHDIHIFIGENTMFWNLWPT